MKNILRIVFSIFFFSTSCLAQVKSQGMDQWQFFAGYSYMRANVREYYKPTPSLYAIRTPYANLNGWDVSITENVKKWFGGTLDASGHYTSPQILTTKTTEKAHSLLYGPHFFHQGRKWRPFAHILMGVTHVSAEVSAPGPSISNTSFTVAPGGGLDWHLFAKGSVRLFQVEYFHTNLEGSSENHLRASAGVVFDFNKK